MLLNRSSCILRCTQGQTPAACVPARLSPAVIRRGTSKRLSVVPHFREGRRSDAGGVPHEPGSSQARLEQQLAAGMGNASHAVTRAATGWLSSPTTQSRLYQLLATASVGLALASLLAPAQLASFAFQHATDPVVDAFVRSSGAALLASATTKWILKEASERQLLDVDTYRRLNLGLMMQSLLMLVVLAQGYSVRNSRLLAIVGPIGGLAVTLSARLYSLALGGRAPLPRPTSVLASLLSLLTPRNFPALVYSAVTLALAGLAAFAWRVAPDVPLDMFTGLAGPITTYMSRTLGAATLLASVGSFCLKDAAERHVLHYKTFRLLNTGLAASNALQALVLLMAIRDGWADPSRLTWTVLGTMAAISAWCAANVFRQEMQY